MTRIYGIHDRRLEKRAIILLSWESIISTNSCPVPGQRCKFGDHDNQWKSILVNGKKWVCMYYTVLVTPWVAWKYYLSRILLNVSELTIPISQLTGISRCQSSFVHSQHYKLGILQATHNTCSVADLLSAVCWSFDYAAIHRHDQDKMGTSPTRSLAYIVPP